ncbi:hypothetical protein [Sphingomonas adhaesiva]|uniref:hypothetical protein n=1 Tax=Sphingomonas adhaesiva TaxID=28212 RepID=UPI002FF87019
MTGAEIMGDLLRWRAPLIAIVAAEWIKTGSLPESAPLPSILVRVTSLTDWQTLRVGALIRSTGRISVAVRAENYRQQGVLIREVRTLHGFTGDHGDARRISIRTAGLGPDVRGLGGSFEQTQDFRVSFDAPA